MLTITIVGEELYNEETHEFTSVDNIVLHFEHSLLSLSKWESKFQKPFLDADRPKNKEEVFGYVEAMILEQDYPTDIWNKFTQDTLNAINAYIDSKESATTFGNMPEHKGRGEVITSELIYYWMVAFNIPFECENWHLNRLFALIKICNLKQGKQKKMSRDEIVQRNRSLNEQRREKLGTNG